jgi:hypothetical protein
MRIGNFGPSGYVSDLATLVPAVLFIGVGKFGPCRFVVPLCFAILCFSLGNFDPCSFVVPFSFQLTF